MVRSNMIAAPVLVHARHCSAPIHISRRVVLAPTILQLVLIAWLCGATRSDGAELQPVIVPAATGQFLVYASFPSRHVTPRRVVVWVPPGYRSGSKRYDVLYMQDGQGLFNASEAFGGVPWAIDQHLLKLEAAGAVRPTLIVGIDNTAARTREYEPAAALQALPPELRQRIDDDAGGPPQSDAYVEFLVGELKPFIDQHFRTHRGAGHTAIMGSSMGALISLYALLRHPEVFGAAGCLSTHWVISVTVSQLTADNPLLSAAAGAYINWIDAHLPPPDAHRLYFDHGTESLDALYGPYQAQVDALLARHGYRDGVNSKSLTFPGATHNEASWQQRVDVPLRFLLAP
jgi:predicted alpha/beta superfamily hydrolase